MNTEPNGPVVDFQRLRSRTVSAAATHRRERLVYAGLIACSLVTLATTVGILVMLAWESSGFFLNKEIRLWSFLTDTQWTLGQTQGELKYGILPLLSGTLRITGIAMLIALPLGLITAVYQSEFASPRVRSILKPALEILAGIPTVVLGYFAIVFITPWLLQPLAEFKLFNATSAGIAVGILCLPLVTSLAEDAIRAVPRSLREGALGMGATRMETIFRVVLPAALSGIVSAFLLAFARAIGETMVVAVAAGSTPTWTWDPRVQAQTMTGFIVNTFQSDVVEPGSLGYYSIYAVAVVLFLITFSLTVAGQLIRLRYRENYQ